MFIFQFLCRAYSLLLTLNHSCKATTIIGKTKYNCENNTDLYCSPPLGGDLRYFWQHHLKDVLLYLSHLILA